MKRLIGIVCALLLVAGAGAQTKVIDLSSTYKCNFLGADNKQ